MTIGSVWMSNCRQREAVLVNCIGDNIIYVWKDKTKRNERRFLQCPAAAWHQRFKKL